MSLPWDEQMRSEQMSMVASAMAYIHLSAASATEKQFDSQTVPYQRLFSPSAYADFISSFSITASKQQQVQLVKVNNFHVFLDGANSESDVLCFMMHSVFLKNFFCFFF